MNKSLIALCMVALLCISFSAAEATYLAGPVTAHFGPHDLVGVPGLAARADVSVYLYETTDHGGTLDFHVTNTSPLTELEPGFFVNSFITHFQFNLPDSAGQKYKPVDGECFVIAPVGVRFALSLRVHPWRRGPLKQE